MSLLRRAGLAFVILATLAALSACGFRPVYGGGALSALDGVQVVGSGESRMDFLIETAVREQIPGGSRGEDRRLTLRTISEEVALGVAGDGRATRYAIEVRAVYSLDSVGGQTPVSGRVNERIVYEAPRDPFALLSARSAAEDRAAQQVATALIQSLSLALRERDDPDFNP